MDIGNPAKVLEDIPEGLEKSLTFTLRSYLCCVRLPRKLRKKEDNSRRRRRSRREWKEKESYV